MAQERLRIAVIGSGGASMAAALKAAEEGAEVTLIEKDVIGGTCINIGCVPSKILLRAAYIAHIRRHSPFDHAITKQPPNIDRQKLNQQQKMRVEQLRDDKYEAILSQNDAITVVRGEAKFHDTNTLKVSLNEGKEQLVNFDKVFIGTGARPSIPNISGLSASPYLTSTTALELTKTPSSIVVIGAGFVALELAQAFARLGTQVTILARSRLLSSEDPAIAEVIEDALTNEGITIYKNTEAHCISYSNNSFKIELSDRVLSSEQLLIATGREANTENLELESIDVQTLNGKILVNDYAETTAKSIYAGGDCTNSPEFVYVAAALGKRAAINMMGGKAKIELGAMPTVMFTEPQVATAGLSEEKAIAQGLSVETRTLQLDQVPRALVNFDTRGFVKMVAERESGKLLGVQVIAADAGEVIQTAAMALRSELTVEQLGNELFPYLTMVEGLKLCAQTFTKDLSQLSCCAG